MPILETSKEFQIYVIELTNRLRVNAQLPPITDFSELIFENLTLIEQQLCVLGDTSTNEKIIFMASVSKVAIAKLAFEITREN